MELDRRTPAVVALILGLGFVGSPTNAAAQPAEKLNLTVELAALERAMPAIDTFDADVTLLRAKASRSPSEIDRLRAEATAIKQHVPAIQSAFTAIIEKLKRAGKWSAASDAEILAFVRRSGDARMADQIVKAGGARAFFEQTTSRAPALGSELDSFVKSLEPKSVWRRLFEPLLGTPLCACSYNDNSQLLPWCIVKHTYYLYKSLAKDLWNAI